MQNRHLKLAFNREHLSIKVSQVEILLLIILLILFWKNLKDFFLKLQMRSIFVIMALVYTFFTFTLIQADAQVNFSPAWGKRSSDLMGDAKDASEYRRMLQNDGCQTPLECLIRLQRLMQVKTFSNLIFFSICMHLKVIIFMRFIF